MPDQTNAVKPPAVTRNASQEAIERASVTALIEKAELEAYHRYRAHDEWMSANLKELQANEARGKDLQQQRQQRQIEFSEFELGNRKHIDGLKAALGE